MMALSKALPQHLLKVIKHSCPNTWNCHVSSQLELLDGMDIEISLDILRRGIFPRFLQKKMKFSPTGFKSSVGVMPLGAEHSQALNEIDVSRDHARPKDISRPGKAFSELTIEEIRKLLRVAQLGIVKSRLIRKKESWILYLEFMRICTEVCGDPKQGCFIGTILDESGIVIILQDYVCLTPEKVTKSIEALLPLQGSRHLEAKRKELEELKVLKATIEEQAKLLVQRELWVGLGFLMVQTIGFMRLTFWELSWDIMEPICFYVTSIYFMGGYIFFLWTTKEPSFKGFYQSRFSVKCKRLMKKHGFDLKRYRDLKKAVEGNMNS